MSRRLVLWYLRPILKGLRVLGTLPTRASTRHHGLGPNRRRIR
jgi:hypothetical protein